jgi:hypothetical protein
VYLYENEVAPVVGNDLFVNCTNEITIHVLNKSIYEAEPSWASYIDLMVEEDF